MRIEKEPFQPDPSSLRLIERVALSAEPDDDSLSDWFHGYITKQKIRLSFDLKIVQENIPIGARILEVGAVPPLLTGALKELGYHVQGIDIAPERFSSALSRLRVNVIKCNIETELTPVDDESFDAVVFNELFEHLRINPIFTMREMYRVLKPGGMLILSTPNLRSLEGILNFLFRGKSYSCSADIYAQYEKLQKLGHMGHVREYTAEEVSEFLEKIGFEIEKFIFRKMYNSIVARTIIWLRPNLRPLMTVIGRRPLR